MQRREQGARGEEARQGERVEARGGEQWMPALYFCNLYFMLRRLEGVNSACRRVACARGCVYCIRVYIQECLYESTYIYMYI